jgi:hypothetical protein
MTIPKEIVWAAVDFAKTVRKYSDISDEQVEQMLDAFDPSLKRQILMSTLNPKYGIRLENGTSLYKINAIKEFRAVTGWGLRESKDFIELAETREGAAFPPQISAIQIDQLAQALVGTGYKVY